MNECRNLGIRKHKHNNVEIIIVMGRYVVRGSDGSDGPHTYSLYVAGLHKIGVGHDGFAAGLRVFPGLGLRRSRLGRGGLQVFFDWLDGGAVVPGAVGHATFEAKFGLRDPSVDDVRDATVAVAGAGGRGDRLGAVDLRTTDRASVLGAICALDDEVAVATNEAGGAGWIRDQADSGEERDSGQALQEGTMSSARCADSSSANCAAAAPSPPPLAPAGATPSSRGHPRPDPAPPAALAAGRPRTRCRRCGRWAAPATRPARQRERANSSA